MVAGEADDVVVGARGFLNVFEKGLASFSVLRRKSSLIVGDLKWELSTMLGLGLRPGRPLPPEVARFGGSLGAIVPTTPRLEGVHMHICVSHIITMVIRNNNNKNNNENNNNKKKKKK